ncbi:hypothetical protein Q9L58_008210 [Maublancomyces gigas]|uniref:TauD/TfdA-like domain-containing protein n=1 Tax=Discina gigas TaxID=1032678 RepID=A0ABR3GAC3_9PEZI
MAVIAAVELTSAKATATTVNAILDILERYRLDSADGTPNRSGEGRSKFVPIIQRKVEAGAPIHMVLPGFPFKSPNSVSKVFGTLPDKAEEFALAHLNALCKSIGDVYKGGAELTIVSDGLVYNDLLGVPDHNVWAYGQAVREIAREKGFDKLKFARLHTLQNVGTEPETLTEEIYLKQATAFRENLQSGVPTNGVAEHLARDEDARATYNSYTSILTDDLANTDKADEEEVTAKKMIARGRAFAAVIQKTFPEAVRLSIHPGSGNNKFSISLFPICGPAATPWHTTLVFDLDGSVHTAHRATIEASPKHEVVCRNGKPWFFREKSDLYTWEGMDIEFEPLYPFGLVITPAPGAAVPSLADVDMTKLRRLSEFNSPVVMRGFRDTKNRELFVGKASEMGTIMPWNKNVDEEDANKPWKFGVVFEVKDSGLTGQVSDEALPMHYDGVFKIEKQLDKNGKEISISQAPRFQYFTAVTPSPKNTGYTLFASSRALFSFLPSPHTVESLSNITWSVKTKTFDNAELERLPLVQPHPVTGTNCLRYHERWPQTRTRFDPIEVSIDGDESKKVLCDVIEELLYDRRVCLWHEWQQGDIVVSDNFSMMHTRSSFESGASRELWRIHID